MRCLALRWLMRGALASALVTMTGVSGAFPYVVHRNETVAQVAERMYGRVELERVVVAANGLDGRRGSEIVPGMRLEIPAVGYRKVLPGDTWKSIAAATLGDPERGDALAQLNDAHPWIRPATGREIVIPYNLRIVAERGDTTQSVAYRYVGHRDKAWLVATYNHLKRARLRQGEIVLVPLMDLTLTEDGKEAARTADALIRSEGGGRAREAQRRARIQIPMLAQDVRRGRYVDAVARGAGLLGMSGGDGLSVPQLAQVYRYLTEAYVALDAGAAASRACAEWRNHEPDVDLDPITYSPKILAACVGDVQRSVESQP
jgi:hypothetical protein